LFAKFAQESHAVTGEHALSPRRSLKRWVITGAIALAAVAIVVLSMMHTPLFGAGSTPSSPAPDSPSLSTQAPSSTAPPASPNPSTSAAPVPFVPDYVLPPIQDGMVPVITRIPTQQKIVFLTIDDGGAKRPENLDLLNAHGIKASLFLAQRFIQNNPDYFKPFLAAGNKIENHTISHPLNLTKLSYQQQKDEICQMADYGEKTYGRRPMLFRPPGGPYTATTRKAAADCGMKAIVTWEALTGAGKMQYQVGSTLRPGDIVLMHFRPEFAEDLKAFTDAMTVAGLTPVLLEDFLQIP
jgi:peptidoglycan/xylan/chitin deacetylase (PgdA/CDA1 family)